MSARTDLTDSRHIRLNGDTAKVSIEALTVDEQQRLMRILQDLIETTRNFEQLEISLAREVNLLKIVIRRAREEGGIDSVLSLVGFLEWQIKV